MSMMVSSDVRRALATAAAVALAALPCSAGTFRVLADESDLVVITHRGGFAAKMAHDHVIAASGYEAHLEFAPEDPKAASYKLTVPVDGLVVDDPEVKARLAPRLEELGVRDRPFTRVSDANRAKIRTAMLDPDQLDAARFPTLSAEAVVSGQRETETDGGALFPYFVRLNVEIRGRKVESEAAARYEYRDGKLVIESLASFRFKEFGIRPYSAFLGAVRNRDEFHVYVRIVAVALEVKPEDP
jgi:hypothetical protein